MKKNSIKTLLSPRLIVVVLFFATSSSVFGQELIRGAIDFLICDTSIVRVYSNDSVIICNRNGRNSTFMNINSGVTNTITLYLDSFYVNDFEIFLGKIFFCGYKIEEGKKKAVCGRFGLSVFTNIPPIINYYVLDTCTEFKKLDVCKCSEFGITDTHVVMIGSTGTRSDVLVDLCMISNSSTTSCWVGISNDEKESLDDVVITQHYVYVSSRRFENGDPLVIFKRYNKPSVLGAHVFTYPSIQTILVYDPAASTPVYLEHKYSDIFSAIYKVIGFSKMAMLELDVQLGTVSIVEILGDSTQTIHPTEIKYNNKSHVYDILARKEVIREDYSAFLPPMRIYHITPAVLNNQTVLGEGTWYSNYYYYLWSIDPMKSSNYYVASGAGVQIPYMFRYTHDEWKLCPRRFEYVFDLRKLNRIEGNEGKIVRKYYLRKYTIEPRQVPIPLMVECGKKGNMND